MGTRTLKKISGGLAGIASSNVATEKSTIKAHVIQRVCQKSVENKKSRKKLTTRHFSQSDLEEQSFEGYSWKNSLSV